MANSFSIEEFGDLDQLCLADERIVEELVKRRDGGNKRLQLLDNRFTKDITKLVQNIITIANAKN